jgi:hypothetical protein
MDFLTCNFTCKDSGVTAFQRASERDEREDGQWQLPKLTPVPASRKE